MGVGFTLPSQSAVSRFRFVDFCPTGAPVPPVFSALRGRGRAPCAGEGRQRPTPPPQTPFRKRRFSFMPPSHTHPTPFTLSSQTSDELPPQTGRIWRLSGKSGAFSAVHGSAIPTVRRDRKPQRADMSRFGGRCQIVTDTPSIGTDNSRLYCLKSHVKTEPRPCARRSSRRGGGSWAVFPTTLTEGDFLRFAVQSRRLTDGFKGRENGRCRALTGTLSLHRIRQMTRKTM